MKKLLLAALLAIISICPAFCEDNSSVDLKDLEIAYLMNFKGDYVSGLDYALKSIEADPTNASAYLQAGIALRMQERPLEALDMYTEAAKHVKKDRQLKGLIFGEISKSYEDIGEYKSAIEYADKAIKEDGKNTDLLLHRGLLLQEMGNKNAI